MIALVPFWHLHFTRPNRIIFALWFQNNSNNNNKWIKNGEMFGTCARSRLWLYRGHSIDQQPLSSIHCICHLLKIIPIDRLWYACLHFLTLNILHFVEILKYEIPNKFDLVYVRRQIKTNKLQILSISHIYAFRSLIQWIIQLLLDGALHVSLFLFRMRIYGNKKKKLRLLIF